jgi:YggT family protein
MLRLNLAHFLVAYGIGFLILAMLVRAIASWFRIDERFAIIRFLARVTDPFIQPTRRLVPPVGLLDFSFFITWFLLQTLQLLLLQSLPVGW